MDWQLLQKYMAGECSPEELRKVEAWLDQDRDHAVQLRFLERIWQVEPRDKITVDAQAGWKEFARRRRLREQRRGKGGQSKPWSRESSPEKGRPLWTPVLAAAAVVALAVMMYLFVPVETTRQASQTEQVVTTQHISAEPGQRKSMRLTDGSLVHLNAGSSIEIPSTFGDSVRLVSLEGEAFFEVEANPNKPFVVQSGLLETRVLGTRFNVSAYPCGAGDDFCEQQVVVEEGLVEMAAGNTSGSRIRPYHKGTLGASGQVSVQEIANMEVYIGWKEGRLVFDAAPFADVIPRLERWYNISVHLKGENLPERQLTASFSDEPMTEVLRVVALSLDMEYSREGRNVIFSSK